MTKKQTKVLRKAANIIFKLLTCNCNEYQFGCSSCEAAILGEKLESIAETFGEEKDGRK